MNPVNASVCGIKEMSFVGIYVHEVIFNKLSADRHPELLGRHAGNFMLTATNGPKIKFCSPETPFGGVHSFGKGS